VDIRGNLKYSKEHEWILVEGDVGTVGITDFAQGELGDVVYVELPDVGTEVTAGEPFGTIEAVKAVAELFAPISGTVAEVNEQLADDAGIINSDCYGEGWMIKIRLADPASLEDLLSPEQYAKLTEKE
jgi:glycine cleavage system H protein